MFFYITNIYVNKLKKKYFIVFNKKLTFQGFYLKL